MTTHINIHELVNKGECKNEKVNALTRNKEDSTYNQQSVSARRKYT